MGPALILLLDTSALIWATNRPSQLTAHARAALESDDNDVWVSAASAWEIATKHRIGRLPQASTLVSGWGPELARFGYGELAIRSDHALRAGSYDVAHADPFDRVIAAQAELEEMILVASDRAFDLFPVVRLW